MAVGLAVVIADLETLPGKPCRHRRHGAEDDRRSAQKLDFRERGRKIGS